MHFSFTNLAITRGVLSLQRHQLRALGVQLDRLQRRSWIQFPRMMVTGNPSADSSRYGGVIEIISIKTVVE